MKTAGYIVVRAEGAQAWYLMNWMGPRGKVFAEQRPRPFTGLFSTRKCDARRFENPVEAETVASRIRGCEVAVCR